MRQIVYNHGRFYLWDSKYREITETRIYPAVGDYAVTHGAGDRKNTERALESIGMATDDYGNVVAKVTR